ncbi:MAG: CoA transferase [Myxococcota bacterium]
MQTSLLEAAIGMLDFQAARWTIDGEVPARQGNHHPTIAPMGCFETSDGFINIAAWDGRVWLAFADAIGRGDLVVDERFSTAAGRAANRDALDDIIAERLRTRATAEWIQALDAVGVPAGPVYAVNELFDDPQVQHIGMVSTVEHPVLGSLDLVANSVSLAGVPREIRRASPERGADTKAILTELGLPAQRIQELEDREVI